MILLRNLVSKINVPSLLNKMFDNKEAGNPPKFDDIVEAIISCLQHYASIFVFFDALDESTKDQMDKMLDLIKRLCGSGIRVFLTSQPHLNPRVQEQLGTIVPYAIRAQENDLDFFIREELKKKFDKQCPDFPVEDKAKIRKSLIDNADGMYIHLRLV